MNRSGNVGGLGQITKATNIPGAIQDEFRGILGSMVRTPPTRLSLPSDE
jgi:hypothetical protein